jgi:hypothetical protein
VWDWLVWAALALAILAACAAMVRLGVLVSRFFRVLNRSRRTVFRELDRVGGRAAAAGERAAEVGAGSERLSASLEQLAASRRRLAVLQAALDEVGETFAWVGLLYPRK